MTNPKKPAPTPAQVDDLCILFDDRKSAVENAQQKFAEAKGELLEAVEDFGSVPAHAPKTKRLEGVIYIADSTRASTIEIDEARVAELEQELSRYKVPKVFNILFERTVRHSLRKDAGSLLKLEIGGLPAAKQQRLALLFTACFAVGSKAPSLSVDLAAALRQKEAEAEAKAAKKAAKAAKKEAAR
jgi:hypothetical protein